MLSDPCVGLLPGSCYASALRAVSCYLEVAAAGMLAYPDGCLSAGYPIRFGAAAGVVEVLASAFGAVDEDPSGGRFADAERASRGMRLPAVAELVPVCPYH